MQKIIQFANFFQKILDNITISGQFIGSLLLRIYLAPIFWFAANNKWDPFDSNSSLSNIIYWFEHGLNLPFPTLSAYLAWSAEYFGAILLALGLATRWICIPLMFTMIIAIGSVHLENGWQAVHDIKSPYASGHIEGAIERLDRAKSILQEHGNYEWLTEYGNFVISNNGIEFGVTYFLMLLALFLLGSGNYISLDHWLKKYLNT